MTTHSSSELEREAQALAYQVVLDLNTQAKHKTHRAEQGQISDSRSSSNSNYNSKSNSLSRSRENSDISDSQIKLSKKKSKSSGSQSRNYRHQSKHLSMNSNLSNDEYPENDVNFFDAGLWKRMSKFIPNSVRDPLNISTLDKEERSRVSRLQNKNRAANKTQYLHQSQNQRLNEKNSRSHSRSPSNKAAHPRSNDPNNPDFYDFLQGDSYSEINFSKEMHSGANPHHMDLDADADGTGLSKQAWMYLQDHNLRNGGLPTLEQVLSRKTFGPLALRDFAVHCSVRQPEAHKWLEFYMAATTHEKMCLSYLSSRTAKSLHKKHSQKYTPNPSSNTNTSSTPPDHKKSRSKKRRQASTNNHGQGSGHSQAKEIVQIQSATESIFMRYFRAALIPNAGNPRTGNNPAGLSNQHPIDYLPYSWNDTSYNRNSPRSHNLNHNGIDNHKSTNSFLNNFGALRMIIKQPIEVFSHALVLGRKSPHSLLALGSMDPDTRIIHVPDSTTNPYSNANFKPKSKSNSHSNPNAMDKSNSVKRQTIYYIPWPPEILSKIEIQLARGDAALDPNLFSEAIMYAYEILNVYYFSVFLKDATTRNCSYGHSVFRLLFGILLLLSFGLTFPISLILLNHDPKTLRLWCIIPQLLGWWNLVVGFSGADILLAVVKKYQSPMPSYVLSKTTFARMWFKTRDSVDPTATKMVRTRSIKMFVAAMAFAILFVVVLALVPGISLYS